MTQDLLRPLTEDETKAAARLVDALSTCPDTNSRKPAIHQTMRISLDAIAACAEPIAVFIVDSFCLRALVHANGTVMITENGRL